VELLGEISKLARENEVLTYDDMGADSVEEMNRIEGQMQLESDQISRDLRRYEILAGSDGRQLLDQVCVCRTNYLVLRNHMLALSHAATNEETSARLNRMAKASLEPLANVYVEALDKCERQEREHADAAGVAALSANAWTDQMLLAGLAGALLLSGAMAFLITRSTTKVLKRVCTPRTRWLRRVKRSRMGRRNRRNRCNKPIPR
jgi:hypothetical protein